MQIADQLLQEHGLEQAHTEVLSALFAAHASEDNYAVSVWREVKQILAKQIAEKLSAA
jgi:hypothetical protein